MKTNLNLEKCLWRATPSLREKMRASIDVLQSGEKIALKYEPDKGFALGFSGGKDSQALYHIAELSGVKFHAFFAPTTIDPPEVIRFIRRNYPEVEIIQPKQSIYKAALKHKMLPISNVRWCCAEFKELWGGVDSVNRCAQGRKCKTC